MAYDKQNVTDGQTITADWGNYIQTQYDEAKADLEAYKINTTQFVDRDISGRTDTWIKMFDYDSSGFSSGIDADIKMLFDYGTGNKAFINFKYMHGITQSSYVNTLSYTASSSIGPAYIGLMKIYDNVDTSEIWILIPPQFRRIRMQVNGSGLTVKDVFTTTTLADETPAKTIKPPDLGATALNADTVDGKHASDLGMLMNSGTLLDTTSIAAGGTYTASIALGASDYKYATIRGRRNNAASFAGSILHVGTTIASGSIIGAIESAYALGYSRRLHSYLGPTTTAGCAFNYTTSGNPYIALEHAFINGSNLELKFYNWDTGSQSLNTNIDWEVFK